MKEIVKSHEIFKSTSISPLKISDLDLKRINKYTLTPLSSEEIFTFKTMMADNEQDDRNFLPFNLKALKDMAELYKGKTLIKDHSATTDNQIGRIFDTELETHATKKTELGEPLTSLIAKVYMIRTDSNKDLISEIMGGIKKEVSTSTLPKKMICNICGQDNMKRFCSHYTGIEYEVKDELGNYVKRTCKFLLDGCKEAFELSFVTIPAQRRAGTKKHFENNVTDKLHARFLSLQLKNLECFFNLKNESEE